MNGSNESVTPEWMTEEWLRSDSTAWGWDQVAALAREILRLRERIRFLEEENIESGKEMAAAIEDRERTNRRWREDTAAMESMRTEVATLTAEVAKLKEHSDHDAEEIMRLSENLASVSGSLDRANLDYAELMKDCNKAEADLAERDRHIARLKDEAALFNTRIADMAKQRDVLHGSVEELRAELAERTSERDRENAERIREAEARERAEAERDAARAELACKGCGGTVGDHLAPDQGGCPGRFVIDGVPMVPAAHVEAARAEVERLNVEVGHTTRSMAKLTRERDAAIRDRNEFAAAQVERFGNDMFCGQSASARAAELRKAAPAAAPASTFTVSEGYGYSDGKTMVVDATPPADLRRPAAPDAIAVIEAARRLVTGCTCTGETFVGKVELLENLTGAFDAQPGEWVEKEHAETLANACKEGEATIVDLTARLAAAEKAKAELATACSDLVREVRKVIPGKSPFFMLLGELVAALEAAERAGGAS